MAQLNQLIVMAQLNQVDNVAAAVVQDASVAQHVDKGKGKGQGKPLNQAWMDDIQRQAVRGRSRSSSAGSSNARSSTTLSDSSMTEPVFRFPRSRYVSPRKCLKFYSATRPVDSSKGKGKGLLQLADFAEEGVSSATAGSSSSH